MYGLLDISTGGMIAQRTRLTAISANIANQNSFEVDGTPYRARRVMLETGDPTITDPSSMGDGALATGSALGVKVADIVADQSPFPLRWDPGHPFAIKEGPQAGYVRTSNVNSVVEQINAMQATRAYEANAAAAEATKAMLAQALRLIA
jgi:flagellar basal-body rod protein FlgC